MELSRPEFVDLSSAVFCQDPVIVTHPPSDVSRGFMDTSHGLADEPAQSDPQSTPEEHPEPSGSAAPQDSAEVSGFFRDTSSRSSSPDVSSGSTDVYSGPSDPGVRLAQQRMAYIFEWQTGLEGENNIPLGNYSTSTRSDTDSQHRSVGSASHRAEGRRHTRRRRHSAPNPAPVPVPVPIDNRRRTRAWRKFKRGVSKA